MTRVFLVLALVFVTTETSAGINDFSNKTITLKPYIESPGFDFNFKSEGATDIKWRPNARAVTGVAFTLNGYFGVGGGFKNGLTTEDKQRKGDTDYQDWRFKFNFWDIYFSAYYQEYTGLYIENSENIDSTIGPDDALIHYEDLRIQNIALNTFWISDKDDFSIEAALDQSVRQESSGGSFVMGAAISQFEFKNPGPVIPTLLQPDYGDDAEIKLARFQSLTVSAGYGHTWVYDKKWFGSLMMLLGAGIRSGEFEVDGKTTRDTSSSSKADFYISGGYNGDEYFSGLLVYGDATTYKTNSIDITSTLWAIQIYFGGRF